MQVSAQLIALKCNLIALTFLGDIKVGYEHMVKLYY